MQKQISLICSNGMQFNVVIDELSALKVVKKMIADISKKDFICFADYVSTNNEPDMWIKTSIITSILIIDTKEQSNIQIPNKNIIFPKGGVPRA